MSESSQSIKKLSDEIIKSLPFLLDPRVNQAASTIIFHNMEECINLASSVNDTLFFRDAFNMCVSYAKEYNIIGLIDACTRWNNRLNDKFTSFTNDVSEQSQDVSVEDKIFKELDRLEMIVNNPDNSNTEELMNAREELDLLEKKVRSSALGADVIKSIRYRIAMLRESLNVSLVIIADLSSVHRLLNNARRYN